METRTRDEDGERENADRLSGLEGKTHFLDDLKFPGSMITQFEIQYSAFEVIFMESNCLFFVEVVSNDSPAAKRPRSSVESQPSPEIEGKLHCTFNSLKSNQRISETIHIEGYTL